MDTHALLWWVGGTMRRFGRHARAFLDRVDAGHAAACVSALSVVELGEALRRGTFPERGDRLIAATALELGYPLVARDPEIAAVVGAETLW